MAVAWVQTVTAWGAFGAGTQTSGSFTGTATDYLIEIFWDGSASGQSRTYGGSLNTPVEGANVSDTTNGNTLGIAGVNNITGGSQTLFVTGSAVSGWGWEYSGVVSTTFNGGNPQGTTTPAGTAITVPTGSILVAWCGIVSAAGTAISPSSNGGITPTTRGSGTNGSQNYCGAEWTGNGGSVTPTFSSSTNGNYVVLQILLTGAASGPTINTQPANQSVYVGQTATFTVSATTSGGSLSYQWQQFISGSWTNVGTNSSSYTTGATGYADNGDLFQVLVTDSNGTTTSSTAVLTVIGSASIAWLQ